MGKGSVCVFTMVLHQQEWLIYILNINRVHYQMHFTQP